MDGNPGLTYKQFEPGNPNPIKVTHGHKNSEISVLGGFDVINKNLSLEGVLTVPETAAYYFTISGLGPSKLLIDDNLIYEQTENCKDSMGFLFGGVPAPEIKVPLKAGQKYNLAIRTEPPRPEEGVDLGILAGLAGVRVGHMSETEHDKDMVAEAIEVAKDADYAIVFTGHETFWETEGQDQVSFNLPKDGSQDRLISAVAKVNPRTIVVNSTGVAIAMPWLDEVQGVLQTWFPGQEAGNSIADILTGRQNPEGHLTCTFPKRIEDCPAYGSFPGEKIDGQLKVTYEEGIFVGYRHFDRLPADKVNFPFGFGLSYTTFDLSELQVDESGAEDFSVSVKVVNTGNVAGATAVQVYVGGVDGPRSDPIKVLVAFSKVHLTPGETATVTLPVKSRDFASYDEDSKTWVVKGGKYNFVVGKSAAQVVLKQHVSVPHQTWKP